MDIFVIRKNIMKKEQGDDMRIFLTNRLCIKKLKNKSPEARDKIRPAAPKPRAEKIWDKGDSPS